MIARAYLANTLQYDDDAAALSRIGTLPLRYATAGALFGALSGYAGYAGGEYPLWVVGIATACAGAIGLAIGFLSRRALCKRLSPGAEAAVAQAAPPARAASRDEMQPRTFANITVATREAFDNPFRMRLYDQGELAREGDAVRFNGRRHSLVIRDIADVTLADHPRFAWMVGAVTFAILAPTAPLVGYLTGQAIAAILLEIGVLALACVWIIAKAKWVRVSWRADDGTAREAYLLDNSALLAGLSWGTDTKGRTRDLLAALAAMKRGTTGAAASRESKGAAGRSNLPGDEALPPPVPTGASP